MRRGPGEDIKPLIISTLYKAALPRPTYSAESPAISRSCTVYAA
jgi:hypothetical protein